MRATNQHLKNRRPLKRQRPARRRVVLQVEQLEGRSVPSTITIITKEHTNE